MENAVFTIVSKNYLGHARVLIDSFLEHNSHADAHVLLVDKVDDRFDPAEENFTLTTVEDLPVEDLYSFCFKYNVLELNTAVKPFFFEHLFRTRGYKKILYFDPDILVTHSLDALYFILEKHNAVVTPHILTPYTEDGKKRSEVDILQAGTFNLGFLGLSHPEKTFPFVQWWHRRLYQYCYSSPARGLFVDQKWINFLPAFLDDVYILRDPGYNVADWNLHERTVTVEDGRFTVDSEPLYFYHFSGFDLDNLERISKHQDRFSLEDFPDLRLLYERYRDLLVARGHREMRGWPYTFGFFDNGAAVPDLARQLYSGLLEEGTSFADPFAADGEDSFFSYLNTPPREDCPYSRFVLYVYHVRADLQRAFPDIYGANRAAFTEWCVHSLERDYRLDERLLPEIPLPPQEEGAVPPGEGSPGQTGTGSSAGLDSLLWQYGRRYARFLKSIPLVGPVAERVFYRLAADRQGVDTVPPAPSEIFREESQGTAAAGVPFGVNIAGYLDTESGVGEAARGIVRAVAEAGIPHSLRNVEQSFSRRKDRSVGDFSKECPYAVNLLHVNADQVPNVADLLGGDFFQGRYSIGYWFWELSVFPEEWRPSFTYLDEVWVASGFCLDSISAASPVPVTKISPSVTVSPNADFTAEGIVMEGHRTFLTIFDFLSYFERKNPMAVVKAFRKAFSPTEEAQLIIKCVNSSFSSEKMELLRDAVRGLKVTIIDDYLDIADLHALIGLCDCTVSLHRSEGFGLPLAEAMLLGRPIIATEYSGNMEFMNGSNSYPVEYRLREIGEDSGPYRKGMVWADPDVGHAAGRMRSVFEQPGEAEAVGRRARATMERDYSTEAAAERIAGRLKILGKMP